MGRSRVLWVVAVAGLAFGLLVPPALGGEAAPTTTVPSTTEPPVAPAGTPPESSDGSAEPRSPSSGSVDSSEATAQEGTQSVGGPVVIMGIDAEDSGPGGHGPISVYEDVAASVQSDVENGGNGILVLGGGKDPNDDVTQFWDAISSGSGIPVTYENGAGVATASFAGFAIVAVVSGDDETSSGGLTAAECQSLSSRQQDFFDHVNGGGGLIVFAQDIVGAGGCEYAFFGGFGAFSFTTGLDYDDIDVTPAGAAAGITNDLDVDAWHDTYQTFPSFLQVLATVAVGQTDEGEVAAIGGASVVIPGEPEPPLPDVVTATPTFTG